jgi:tetratricopeptide (TPR) repeat protein
VASARVEELRKRLEKEPGSRLFAQLAEELRKEGELDEAIRICREGLHRHANYPSAHMTLGRALFDTGDLPGARGEFESVLRGAPDNILASRLLGECLEALGDLDGARARYQATLALSGSELTARTRLQALEERLGVPTPPPAPVTARPVAHAAAPTKPPVPSPPKPAVVVTPGRPLAAPGAAGKAAVAPPPRPVPAAAPSSRPPVAPATSPVGPAAPPPAKPAPAAPPPAKLTPAAPSPAKPAPATSPPARPATGPVRISATVPPSGGPASALSVVAAAVAAAKAKAATRVPPAVPSDVPAPAAGAPAEAMAGPAEETVLLDGKPAGPVSSADSTLVMEEPGTPGEASSADRTLVMEEWERPIPLSTEDTAFDLEPLSPGVAGAAAELAPREPAAGDNLVADEAEQPIPLAAVEDEAFELERPDEAPPVRFGEEEKFGATAALAEEELPATIPFRAAPADSAEEFVVLDEGEAAPTLAPIPAAVEADARTIALDRDAVEAALLAAPDQPRAPSPELAIDEDLGDDTRTVALDQEAVRGALHPERTMAVDVDAFESTLSAREALLAIAPTAPPIPYDAEVRTIGLDAETIAEALTGGSEAPSGAEAVVEPGAEEAALPAEELEVVDEAEAGLPAEAPAAALEAELASVTLAELYLGQGVRDKAIEVLRQVINREPENARAQERLAEIEQPVTSDRRAARRQALERTIARLESMLAAARRG